MSGVESLLDGVRVGSARAGREIIALGEKSSTPTETVDELLDGLAAIHREKPEAGAVELMIGILYAQPFVRAEIYRLVMRDVEAEEVLQETLLAVARSLAEFRGDSKVRTWVRRIAHNQAVAVLRRRRETTGADGDVGEGPGEVERFSSVLATRNDVQAALNLLAPEFEQVVRLRDLEHLSYERIAEILDIKLNTVRSRLARGRAKLAVVLEQK